MQLVQLLDHFIIDNYNDEMVLNETISPLVNLELPDNVTCNVEVQIRKKNQVLSNRGGLAHNKASEEIFFSPCILPFFQLIIRPDGKVSQCCQDAYGRVTLGDVSKESITEVWMSEAYQKMRDAMLAKNGIEGGRHLIKTCATCDTFGMTNLFPEEWRRLYTEAMIEIVWDAKKEGKAIALVASGAAREKLEYILLAHGIKPEINSASIMNYEENVFYIFGEYNDAWLEHFVPEDSGVKFLVYDSQLFHLSFRLGKEQNGYKLFQLVLEAQNTERLVIFGAGNNARLLYEKYQLVPKVYIDNNKERWGSAFYGKTVVGCEKEYLEDKLILVSANAFASIYEQLMKMGVKKENIIDGTLFL